MLRLPCPTSPSRAPFSLLALGALLLQALVTAWSPAGASQSQEGAALSPLKLLEQYCRPSCSYSGIAPEVGRPVSSMTHSMFEA